MRKKPNAARLFKKLKLSWQKALHHLLPFGGFSYFNRVKVIHDGDEAFSAIFAAIADAKDSIFVETFILAADRLGIHMRTLLMEAKARGVAVTILFDHLGSPLLTNGFLQPMAEIGITVVRFNPFWPWRRRGPLLFRDHRKIIVIDEKTAFCGSSNISADYAGPVHGTNRFRDTIAVIEGPAVADLLAITKESIAESLFDKRPETSSEMLVSALAITKAVRRFLYRLRKPNETLPLEPDHRGTLVQVLRSNRRRNLSHIQRCMEEIVNRAVSYCYFTTPYFLPQEGLRKALINAQLRGVDVRILTAGNSDVPLMCHASHHVYTGFLTKGIRIYEMTGKTLHAKIATIDGIFSSIGSYNLDHWSARRNLEVNLSLMDQEIALALKDQFAVDLASSCEIVSEHFFARSRFRRVLCWLAYLLIRI